MWKFGQMEKTSGPIGKRSFLWNSGVSKCDGNYQIHETVEWNALQRKGHFHCHGKKAENASV